MAVLLPHIPRESRRFMFMMKRFSNRNPEIVLSFGLSFVGLKFSFLFSKIYFHSNF